MRYQTSIKMSHKHMNCYSRLVMLLQLLHVILAISRSQDRENKMKCSRAQMRCVHITVDFSGSRLLSWLHQHCSIACPSISVIALPQGIDLHQLRVQLLEPLLAFSRILLQLLASTSWQREYVPDA